MPPSFTAESFGREVGRGGGTIAAVVRGVVGLAGWDTAVTWGVVGLAGWDTVKSRIKKIQVKKKELVRNKIK